MYTSSNLPAAIMRTADLANKLTGANWTSGELARYIADARSRPGTTISTGGLTFVHYLTDPEDTDSWSQTNVFLNIAEYMLYNDGTEQQFVFERGNGDEYHESVPEEWK